MSRIVRTAEKVCSRTVLIEFPSAESSSLRLAPKNLPTQYATPAARVAAITVKIMPQRKPKKYSRQDC